MISFLFQDSVFNFTLTLNEKDGFSNALRLHLLSKLPFYLILQNNFDLKCTFLLPRFFCFYWLEAPCSNHSQMIKWCYLSKEYAYIEFRGYEKSTRFYYNYYNFVKIVLKNKNSIQSEILSILLYGFKSIE